MGWVASLVGDLRWLTVDEHFECGRDWTLSQWVHHFSGSPCSMLKRIKKICNSPFANICSQWATSPVLQQFASPVVCYICGHISPSLQAHSVHNSSSHGIKSKFRRYVDGTHCRICLCQFWTRERCLNHVRYRSKICQANTLMRGPVLSQEESDALDRECCAENQLLHSAGKRRHFVDFPVIRLIGPLLLVLTLRHSGHHPLGFGYNYH